MILFIQRTFSNVFKEQSGQINRMDLGGKKELKFPTEEAIILQDLTILRTLPVRFTS